ncbi:MAG: Crp/Fnr family transcriptional regulator [Acidimicrobiia bacterium]|nr:Crp/Fnr family transcriptional regulator [Acidimicrobiia bacterium]
MDTDSELHTQARLIGRAALFSGLRASRLLEMSQHAFTQHLEAGDVLFREGDRGSSMFVLGQGKVRLFVTGPDGSESTLAVLEPPDTFGELAIFDQGARSASAVALEASVVVGLPSQAVRDAYRNDADLADNLLRTLAALVRAATQQRSTVVFWDLAGRVSRELLALADEHGDETLYLNPHAAFLAARAGGSDRAVVRILGQLERDGLIRIEGAKVAIVDRERLAERATHG